jgi:hypothetical protein
MNALVLEYEKDFHSWIYKNIDLLRQGRLADVNIDILIDELDSMAKRDKRELMSHFMVLIAHLLKWEFQPLQRSSSWRGSIREQRIKITEQLEESPSLNNQLTISVEKAYPKALLLAIEETRLHPKNFPQTCPYSIEQLLDDDFYPDFQS